MGSTNRPERALFRRHPGLVDLVPLHALATLPTPVEQLELDGLPSTARLWIKRDDLTGEAYGGNKTRKLEFLVGDALARGCKRIWTVGAIGSNHCLATTIHARRAGLGVRVLHFLQPITDHVEHNLRAIAAAGAELTLASPARVPAAMARRFLKRWLSDLGDEEYFVPAGGSSPVGVLGYVNAARELADQVEAGELPKPRRIYVAAGTCGTLAGLRVGLALAGWHDVELHGVRVIDRLMSNPLVVRRLVGKVLERLTRCGVRQAEVAASRLPPLELVQSQFGPGYGHPTVAGQRARQRMAEADGPPLEPTYTAKAVAALLADADAGQLDGDVLYWHTLNSRPIDALVESMPLSALPRPYHRLFFD